MVRNIHINVREEIKCNPIQPEKSVLCSAGADEKRHAIYWIKSFTVEWYVIENTYSILLLLGDVN